MSSQFWGTLYSMIVREARAMEPPSRKPKYPDSLVVAMFLWMVFHDRTQAWACERSNYHGVFRPRRLPSPSRFSRRLRDERCTELLRRVVEAFGGTQQAGYFFLDSRPLTVGACSQDPEATAGRVYGGFARGYRLHVLVDEYGTAVAWKVTSMNTAEVAVAPELLRQVPPHSCVLADANYDRAPLYEEAEARGVTLLAKPRKNAGKGHHRQSPARLAAIALWNTDAATFTRMRWHVERAQAHQSTFVGGLQPLPAWVRRRYRVERWVAAKLVIYHVRMHQKQRAA